MTTRLDLISIKKYFKFKFGLKKIVPGKNGQDYFNLSTLDYLFGFNSNILNFKDEHRIEFI